MTAPRVIALFGPTGVGKTAVATALAARLRADGEEPVAVSADALQVYAGLETLTGAPTPAEREALEHRLVTFLPVTARFSVGQYAALAHAEIDSLLAAGRRPIVLGGTGLYLRAALADLRLRPPPAPGARERWEGEVDRRGSPALHAELRERASWAADPIDPHDARRVVRALELLDSDGLQPSAGGEPSQLWTGEMRHPTLLAGLVMDRAALYERIDARVDATVASGGVEEVRRAEAAGASETARQALGFAELLAGDVEAMKRRTRNYARRQLTWMRKLAGARLVDVTGRPPADVAVELSSLAVRPRSAGPEGGTGAAGSLAKGSVRGGGGTVPARRDKRTGRGVRHASPAAGDRKAMTVKFEKWQALGNDYMILEARQLAFELTAARTRRLCDRHAGVGADGVLLLEPTDDPGFVARVRIFNPDGSEAELSGNGAREAVMYLRRRGWVQEDRFSIHTAAGEVRPTITGPTTCTMDMGRAKLRSVDYPRGDETGAGVVRARGREWRFQHVSIGNPQCVIFVEPAEIEDLDVAAIGPEIERHELFPNRTNVSWVAELEGGILRARIFERGVGETLSSGTGATGAAVAYVLLRGADPDVTVRLDGGELTVEVGEHLHVNLTGWAVPVYAGELAADFVEELDATE